MAAAARLPRSAAVPDHADSWPEFDREALTLPLSDSEDETPMRYVDLDAIRVEVARYRRNHRRHPATVTADRLADAMDKWSDLFQPHERDATGQMIHA